MNQAHYERVWRMLRFLAGGALRSIFAYRCETVLPDAKNYLVVANHNTDLDPALVGLAFPRQMFFLASEHVFRKGIASRLLQYLFRPISRIKGTADAAAAMDAVRMLRKGRNLCLFAEGNRSFNGVTGPIFPATGKLAKASGAALVTFRLTGGYLTRPRWSKTQRRGYMHGECVHVYPPEQLKAMSADEVNEAIRTDLYEDAFARQLAQPHDYRGKRLAEGLEDALFLCPRCGGISTLVGEGDRFCCKKCSLQVRYNVRGFFEGVDGMEPPFANVRDWDIWQRGALDALLKQQEGGVLFEDTGMQLVQLGANHAEQVISSGTLRMDNARLQLGSLAFLLAEITDMALVGPTRVVFSVGAAHYEIRSDRPRYCGRRYWMLYQLCKTQTPK